MRWQAYILAAWAVVAGAGSAGAAPLGSYLGSWSQGGLTLITDGTSNTIQFGENTRFNVCFDNVGVPGTIADGTSNTILFGENAGFFVIPGGHGPRVPIGTITDGTSNTIIIGETVDLCFNDVVIDPTPPNIADGTSNTIIIGEGSRFDICFRNVDITDGTSNTIQIGESGACFTDLQVAAVPSPSALAGALAGLALLPLGLRRRRSAG